MTEEQKNRMHPGAYKSCLIPYSEAIFNWWYDEQLPTGLCLRRYRHTTESPMWGYRLHL